MIKKVLSIVLIVLVASTAGIYYFSGLRPISMEPWSAIPENAAIIIESDHPGKLFEKLNDNNELWSGLLNNGMIRSLNDEFSRLDSLQIVRNSNLFREHSVYISIHPETESGVPDALLLVHLAENEDLDYIKQVISDCYSLKPIDKNNNFFELTSQYSELKIYLSVYESLLIASTNKVLTEQSVQAAQLKSNQWTSNVRLQKLRSIAGSKVDCRVFINYKNLGGLLNQFANDDYIDQVNWLSRFASWSEVDLLFKKNELLMSGFTVLDSLGITFLSEFKDQENIKHGVFNILPFNTNFLLSLGFSNFDQFPFATDLSTISNDLNFDITKIIDMIDGEIALADNSTKPESIKRQSWFFIRTSDKNKTHSYLKQISRNTQGKTTEFYSRYEINHINYKGLIPKVFGDVFSTIQDNWFTQIGNYIVFGNSKETLINFIRIYETGKTLDLNENFKAFNDNLAENSNLLFFIKLRDFINKSESFVNQQTHKDIRLNENIIKDFDGLAIQFSAENELFFTNFYLKSNKYFKDENLALWKTQLDDNAAGKPYLVKDHNTGSYNIVVFDNSSNMYLVSTDGRILWKKRIDALPESQIFEVDYYKNGKIQYLFNSPDFIYLTDKNGDNVTGYPKKINPSATNGLNLFDYNNKRDYRLVVAQSDKNVYNYTLKGKQVKGWSKPKTQNIVIEPVERKVTNRKDYFIITDLDNNISIVNRKGKQRIKLKQDLDKAKFSTFYINQTNSKGIIITTNKEGKLVYLSESGKLQFTDFGDFSPAHFFLYEDFNADGSKDFIFIDGDQLFVFDRFKNVLFNYQFESAISIKPEFFRLSRKQRVLGIVADQEKTIYLFDNEGNTLINKGLVGETPFTVGSLENNNELNLVTSAGSTLYNYRID